MEQTKRVAYKDVKLGDQIYHPDYYVPDKWRKVTNIIRGEKSVSLGVGISARAWDTRLYFVGYPEQGITIREK